MRQTLRLLGWLVLAVFLGWGMVNLEYRDQTGWQWVRDIGAPAALDGLKAGGLATGRWLGRGWDYLSEKGSKQWAAWNRPEDEGPKKAARGNSKPEVASAPALPKAPKSPTAVGQAAPAVQTEQGAERRVAALEAASLAVEAPLELENHDKKTVVDRAPTREEKAAMKELLR